MKCNYNAIHRERDREKGGEQEGERGKQVYSETIAHSWPIVTANTVVEL